MQRISEQVGAVGQNRGEGYLDLRIVDPFGHLAHRVTENETDGGSAQHFDEKVSEALSQA